ncbi:MAG TPA: citramalate synthase [Mariprofundaceae bacterium]|nr:citramalate synthase [Mariprofundaceae bacterium]
MDRSRRVELYDTTLRDGAQTAGIHFSIEDKLRIANRLADFGMDWIEGGWPGASPKDDRFFEQMRQRHWSKSRLVAFGSTARPGGPVAEDQGLLRLAGSGAEAACIFGKSWDLHVEKALGISRQQNLDLVHESVACLKARLGKVFFDAEHFFDGYNSDADYALAVLDAAFSAGADVLVLCDTNGGTIPYRIAELTGKVLARFPEAAVGIHAHNDCELAVANTIAAVRVGARHLQGTVNGIGERCGNANLVSVIPTLQLKMDFDCGIASEQLKELRALSDFVNEMANRLPWRHQPYIGDNAFAHKGGIHVSAIRKDARLYEHIDPALVGNVQRVLVSDQAGKSNVLVKLEEMDDSLELDANNPVVAEAVRRVKELEAKGYAFEGADASFKLLLLRAMGRFRHYFELEGFRVFDEKRGHEGVPESEATVQIRVGKRTSHTAALGNGPINAMDKALRSALMDFYPQLADMRLTDFKVRVLSTKEATQAAVRVLIESTDGRKKWGTVGVSTDVLDAAYQALVDAIEFKLFAGHVEPPVTKD